MTLEDFIYSPYSLYLYYLDGIRMSRVSDLHLTREQRCGYEDTVSTVFPCLPSELPSAVVKWVGNPHRSLILVTGEVNVP
jgi:hypothetical protein